MGREVCGAMLMLSLADSMTKFRECGKGGHLTHRSLGAFLSRSKVGRVLTLGGPRKGNRRGIPGERETSLPQPLKGIIKNNPGCGSLNWELQEVRSGILELGGGGGVRS